MKTLPIACVFVSSLFVLQNLSGQGFVNLDFNSAQLSAYGAGPASVPASNAIPGWTGYLGTNQQTMLVYNDESAGSGNLSIIGTNCPISAISPIPGNSYTVVLQPGPVPNSGSPYSVNASIAQTGLVPATALSILFTASTPPLPGVQVTIAGQVIPIIKIASINSDYGIYGGDISAFAGHVAQLEFTDFAATEETEGSYYLDAISFSSSPIPEPGTLSLFGICIPLIWLWARPNYSPENPPTTPVRPHSRFASEIRRCSGR
jgi:hypothetical protein